MHQVSKEEFNDTINLISTNIPVRSEFEPDFWQVFYVGDNEIGFSDILIEEYFLHE